MADPENASSTNANAKGKGKGKDKDRKVLAYEDYTVGWVCALPLEMAAAKLMLDETHAQLPPRQRNDHNTYELGEIAGHNVVIACLPKGVYGTTSAAVVAEQMKSTFLNIRIGLMVGIGGGVPGGPDIRLGDVVVSQPTGPYGGVVQYDFGKTVAEGKFNWTGSLNKPPQLLLTAMAHLEADSNMGNTMIQDVISKAIASMGAEMGLQWAYPGTEHDRLFQYDYDHETEASNCSRCDENQIVERQLRASTVPQVHYGLIASANQVMKHGETRERLRKELGVLCFEMEAAGLMDNFPCLVVRGICDYADSHKNKRWQGYAALSAAAYTKVLLSRLSPSLHEDSDFEIANAERRPGWIVPFDRNSRFVGRQSQLKELEQKLFGDDHVRRVAICGLGGVGKTQIALELAYRVRSQHPDCSIFWVPSTSLESIEQAYVNIGAYLGLRGASPAEVKSEVQNHLSQENTGRWLLIFDNADDMDMWITGSDTSPALKSFLPHSDYGQIIFTTRNRQVAVRLASPNVIAIPQMDEPTARNMLEVSLIDDQRHLLDDPHTTSSLLRSLDYLPLAISQAAAYVNEMGTTLAGYMDLFQEQEEDLVELLSKDFEDEWRYNEIKNPVATTWLISFHHIRRLSALAADYLSLIACVDPRDIPLSLLPPGRSAVEQQDALGILQSYSFITLQSTKQFLSLHRLVHLATRNWLRKENLLVEWTIKTTTQMNKAFPDVGDPLWRAYLPHAQCLLQRKEFQETKDGFKLCFKAGRCMDRDGRYMELEAVFLELLKRLRARTGKDDPDTIEAMHWITYTYGNQGRWNEAEDLQTELVKKAKKVYGPNDIAMFVILLNSGWILHNQGRLAESEKSSLQLLKEMNKTLGPEHRYTLLAMSNLASTYWRMGEDDKARDLETNVMKTRSRVLGPEHLDTLRSMAEVAKSRYLDGKTRDAAELELQLLEIRKRKLGPEHPDTALSMANLAQCWWDLGGKDEEALSLLQDSARILNDKLGPRNQSTIMSTKLLRKWQSSFSSPPSPPAENGNRHHDRDFIVSPGRPTGNDVDIHARKRNPTRSNRQPVRRSQAEHPSLKHRSRWSIRAILFGGK